MALLVGLGLNRRRLGVPMGLRPRNLIGKVLVFLPRLERAGDGVGMLQRNALRTVVVDVHSVRWRRRRRRRLRP